ncbi:hypothetical protein ACUTJJ_04970 [Agrobacterium sp. DKPNP3]|uniref:hypothetical protein n=1 Tax=Agrobacterium sp. DKPNP3 TaxID=3457323 RepID=UPI0040441710
MTKVQDLTEIDALADGDLFYVADVSNPGAPDRKVTWSKMKAAGVRITNRLRYDGPITIPTIAAGAEGTATINVPGAAIGDHVIFNPNESLASNLGIMAVRVSAADIVSVRFRNFGGSSFTTVAMACVALVSRSV